MEQFYGNTQDGITLASRFNKAAQTIRAEQEPDRAQAMIKSLCYSKFGLTVEQYKDMIQHRQFGKLAIQERRWQHEMAEAKTNLAAIAEAMLADLDTLAVA